MADKSFGVKELNLLNASGTPTVTSPNNLNLNANTVAISTSATVGSNLTVSGQINVGNNIKIGNAGVCTATTFVGNLTGTASANAVLTGSTNNQLVTVTGANAITGESTLTYDGTSIFELQPSSATPARFIGDANRTGQGQHLAQFEGNWNGTLVGRMVVVAGEDTSNKDDGHLDFFTTSSGGSNARILRITSGGQVNIGDDFTQTTYKTQIETTNQNVLRLVTDSDDANGVELVLRKDSASPADNDNIGNIYFQGNDDSGASTFYASMEAYSDDVSNNSENGYIRFRTRNDGTMAERLRIQSGGGISFNGDTAADNALHDYEEGNYGVSITGSGGGSIGMQSGINNLRYTKIGRLVHVTGRIYLNSSNNPSGTAKMSLPFTSSANDSNSQNGQGYSYVTRYNVYNPNSDWNLIFEIEPNQSYGFFLWDKPGAAWDGVNAGSQLNQNACYLGFDFTYTTAT